VSYTLASWPATASPTTTTALASFATTWPSLRAKGLVQRLGRTRRYRLTPQGAKLGVLLVKLRTRLLGPLATLAINSSTRAPPLHPNSVDTAFRDIDTALDHLCVALGLQPAA
jgi:hypothetical protein